MSAARQRLRAAIAARGTRANRVGAAIHLRPCHLRPKTAIRSRQDERIDRKILRPSMRHQLESFGQERLQHFRSLLRRDVGWRVRDDVKAIDSTHQGALSIVDEPRMRRSADDAQAHVGGDHPPVDMLDRALTGCA